MVPMAVLVGRKADRWGRKPIFLVGFAALPLRGLLYTLDPEPLSARSPSRSWMGSAPGSGAAPLFFIVIADLTKGSGRYNLALGASGASWGLGAALSNARGRMDRERRRLQRRFPFPRRLRDCRVPGVLAGVSETAQISASATGAAPPSGTRAGRWPRIERRPASDRRRATVAIG